MDIGLLHIGMKVRHPHYGEGVVRALEGLEAAIDFSGQLQRLDPGAAGLEPAQPYGPVTREEARRLIEETALALADRMGFAWGRQDVEGLARRWQDGALVLRSADPALQPKEVPLETFFHKIVLMRNQLRVLEQKINGHAGLTDADKVELQQYISRCYGSMTTFNVLFRNREDQFQSGTGAQDRAPEKAEP